MSERQDNDLLKDIIESMERILLYSSDIEYKDFLTDFKTQDAVIRNIEIIGEAVKSLSDNLKTSHLDIPWKDISGTRDILIHHYFGVNIDIVWNIIKADIPVILGDIKCMLKTME